MRLRHLVPPLSEVAVQALEDIGVKTDIDLLLTDNPINIFTKLLPRHDLSLKDFHSLISQVTELCAAASSSGDNLYEQDVKRRDDFVIDDMLVGVHAVDRLIGGFTAPRVVEVSGDHSSGKTALALQVVLRHLSRVEDSSALWIDSNGDFSPDRVSYTLKRLGGSWSSTALERLQVSLAFDLEAVHEVLEVLRQSLTTSPGRTIGAASPVTRFIVIDSVTSLFGPLLSATSSQGHAIMTTFMRQLRAFANSFCLTVIVLNSSTRVGPRNPDAKNPDAVFETARKPALGPSFTFITDATLWLSLRPKESAGEDNSTVHTVEVFRSRTTRSKGWATFSIKDGLLTSA